MRRFRFVFLVVLAWSCSDDEAAAPVAARDGGSAATDGGNADARLVDGAPINDGSVGASDGAADAATDGTPAGTDGATPPIEAGPGARFALDFPSNVTGGDQSAPFVALQYDNPHLNGLPFAGPGNAGVTYMW